MPALAYDAQGKKRYDPSLVGMPVGLADRAQANLDSTDASISRINTILARNPTPGVGAPGSTPQTDVGNLEMAHSMERADRGNRFGFNSPQYLQNSDVPSSPESDSGGGIDIGLVNQRRNKILAGIDPDSGTRFSTSPDKTSAHRQQALLSELPALTGIVHEDAGTRAAAEHQNLLKHRDIAVFQQSENIFKGLQDIAPDGSPENAKKFLNLISQNRLAVDASSAIRAEIKRHAEVHDRLATPIAPQVDPATGLAWNGSRWVSPPLVPGNAPDKNATDKLHKDYGISQGQFDARASTALVKANPNAPKRASEPYIGANDGDLVKLSIPGENGKLKSVVMPKADYLKYGGKLSEQDAGDLKSLAQKAIDDPKASPEHKAAAKRILGQ